MLSIIKRRAAQTKNMCFNDTVILLCFNFPQSQTMISVNEKWNIIEAYILLFFYISN